MDNMYLALLELLLAKTKQKEANWIEMSPNNYRLLLKDSSVEVDFTSSEVWGCIYNVSGDTIVSLRENQYPLLRELLKEITAYILRSEETLTSMLEELSKPGRVGAGEQKSELPF